MTLTQCYVQQLNGRNAIFIFMRSYRDFLSDQIGDIIRSKVLYALLVLVLQFYRPVSQLLAQLE